MKDERSIGAYASHEQLVAKARPYPDLWRLLVGLAIVVATYTILNLILFGLAAGLGPSGWQTGLQNGSSPLAMLVLLASFGFVTFGVTLAAKWMQHRTLTSVIGRWSATIPQFRVVLRALLILGAVIFVLPPYDYGAPLVPNLAFFTWLALLPLSVLVVLIQTSAEEILFRGYLQQSLAARFRSPLIWMGLPSLLFAVGHYAPAAAGDNAMLVAVWAFIFGLLTADLTARAGTLAPAIALHFFNNAVALLVVSLPDSLSGLALYHLPYDMTDTGVLRQWLIVDFAVMIVSWLTVRLALRR